MNTFSARLEIIGVNPYVAVPQAVLSAIFAEAGKDKGQIPIHGTVNGVPFKQTLVRYSGAWRLYINMVMLKNSPKRIGEELLITVGFDAEERIVVAHPAWLQALQDNPEAKAVFDSLAPSRQKEIVLYIARLKSEDAVDRNVKRAIDFLLGKGRFVGRDKP